MRKINILTLFVWTLSTTACMSFYSDYGTPGIDRNGIRKTFSDHQKEILGCYEPLAKDLSVKGKVVFDFDIDDKGLVRRAEVSEAKSTLKNNDLNSCLLARLKEWQFPASPPTITTQIFYPIMFSPESPNKDADRNKNTP